MSKSLTDIQSSITNIVYNVKNYYSGNQHAYQLVAVELRKLLCDTFRGKDISLLKRVIPDFHLKPLCGSQEKIDPYTVLYIPGKVLGNEKSPAKLSELINENANSLSLEGWLAQKFLDNSTTVHNFIRSIADKEGAHSDEEYNEILKKSKYIKFSSVNSLCGECVIVFGKYIVKELAIWMVNKDLKKIWEYITNQYNSSGKGIAILNLSNFASGFNDGFTLPYQVKQSFLSKFKTNSQSKQLADIIDNYDPSRCFILCVEDINGEIWIYQQKGYNTPPE